MAHASIAGEQVISLMSNTGVSNVDQIKGTGFYATNHDVCMVQQLYGQTGGNQYNPNAYLSINSSGEWIIDTKTLFNGSGEDEYSRGIVVRCDPASAFNYEVTPYSSLSDLYQYNAAAWGGNSNSCGNSVAVCATGPNSNGTCAINGSPTMNLTAPSTNGPLSCTGGNAAPYVAEMPSPDLCVLMGFSGDWTQNGDYAQTFFTNRLSNGQPYINQQGGSVVYPLQNYLEMYGDLPSNPTGAASQCFQFYDAGGQTSVPISVYANGQLLAGGLNNYPDPVQLSVGWDEAMCAPMYVQAVIAGGSGFYISEGSNDSQWLGYWGNGNAWAACIPFQI